MASDDKRRLLQLFNRLEADQRASLLDYAEFLHQRQAQSGAQPPPPPPDKLAIPRPDDESVIAAIKRLRQTYPMLEGRHLLNQTSSYLSEHLLQGQSATRVIDKLELYFEQAYLTIRQGE